MEKEAKETLEGDPGLGKKTDCSNHKLHGLITVASTSVTLQGHLTHPITHPGSWLLLGIGLGIASDWVVGIGI